MLNNWIEVYDGYCGISEEWRSQPVILRDVVGWDDGCKES